MANRNRVPFNSLVEPDTKKTIKAARKTMGVSEGGVIDVWAAFHNAVNGIGTPAIKDAANNLLTLMRQSRKKKHGRKQTSRPTNHRGSVSVSRPR